jgi:hypothetical protein
MMLHHGRDDEVAAAEGPPAERRREQVDRLGRAAEEDDLGRARCVQEPRDARARRLVGVGRLDAAYTPRWTFAFDSE